VVSKKEQSNFFRRNYPRSRVAQLLKEFQMKLVSEIKIANAAQTALAKR
jgi:hypothetical protein